MGSPSGLWTSVSGGQAQSQNIDTISNNIANANTVGYKKDEIAFKEYLTSVENPGDPVIDIPRTAFKDSDFYHHDGRENAMVDVQGVHTDHAQGHYKQTGGAFDLAVEGPGFFALQTPQGIQYTRAGAFLMNAQGQLVNADGHQLLGLNADGVEALEAARTAAQEQQQSAQGAPTAQVQPAAPNLFATALQRQPAQVGSTLGPIVVGAPASKVTVSAQGRIYEGDTLLGAVVLAEFPDVKRLKKAAGTTFVNEDPTNTPLPARLSRVHQGALEQSNVNATSELVNLIKANRLFEGNMRALKVYGDMAAKEANEVGKL